MGNNNELEAIGRRIAEAREDKGYTQSELANIIGTSRENINYWENGKRDMKTQQIALLAKHLDVSADYLLGLSSVKTTDMDIAAICDYIGLNEYVIKTLHKKHKTHSLLGPLGQRRCSLESAFLNKAIIWLAQQKILQIVNKISLATETQKCYELMYDYEWEQDICLNIIFDCDSNIKTPQQLLDKAKQLSHSNENEIIQSYKKFQKDELIYAYKLQKEFEQFVDGFIQEKKESIDTVEQAYETQKIFRESFDKKAQVWIGLKNKQSLSPKETNNG